MDSRYAISFSLSILFNVVVNQGVRVTHDELAALVEELGLEGEEAEDLVKGLGEAKPDEVKPTEKTETEPDQTAAEPDKTVAETDKTAPGPVEKTEVDSDKTEAKPEKKAVEADTAKD
jgi:SH3 domain-binding glutamic acid-rich protein